MSSNKKKKSGKKKASGSENGDEQHHPLQPSQQQQMTPGVQTVLCLWRALSSTQKFVAFICGIPATLKMYERAIPIVKINFLCVHKKLRSKRLAPVLIVEISRRLTLTGVFQAVPSTRPVGTTTVVSIPERSSASVSRG